MEFLIELAALGNPHKHTKRWSKAGQTGYAPVEGAITPAMIEEHLKGGEDSLGMYLCTEGTSGALDMTRALVLDFDDHDKAHKRRTIEVRVGAVAGALEQRRVPYFVVRSGSGHGYHVWVVFDAPRRDDSVREAARSVIEDANKLLHRSCWPHETMKGTVEGGRMFVETKKVFESHLKETIYHTEHFIETMPKGKGWQNVALPLGRKSVLMRSVPGPDGICNLEEHPEPAAFKLTYSKKQKSGPSSGGGPRASKAVDVDAAFEALRRVRGSLDDYGKWLAGGFMLKAALGEAGFDYLLRWSKESANFKSEQDVRDKWEKDLKSPRTPARAFWAYALKGGYAGGLPEGIAFTKADISKTILEDIIGSADLFVDRDGAPFAKVGPRRVMKIGGQDFEGWLRRTAYAEAAEIVSAETLHGMVATARAHAQERRDVHLRLAFTGELIFVDLADDADTILRISKSGIEVIDGEQQAPVLFRRSRQLPIPWTGEGSLDDLREMVNMDEDQFILMVACIAKMFLPGTASPIVNITGEYGAAKTATTHVMRSVVDPVSAMSGRPTDKEDDLLIRCWHNAVLTLENMSSLAKISDTLCSIVTGAGFETRQLFSNGDLFSIYIERPVIVNGIDATKYRSDLISRMISIALVKPKMRWSETEFKERLQRSQPRMFHAMMDLMVGVLGMLPDIPLNSEVRLGDFARVGEAVARIMGRRPGWFTDHVVTMQNEAEEDALSDNVVAKLLHVNFGHLSGHTWSGNPSELLTGLRIAADNISGVPMHRIPETASALGQQLLLVKPGMEKRGWLMEKVGRRWIIKTPKHANPFEGRSSK